MCHAPIAWNADREQVTGSYVSILQQGPDVAAEIGQQHAGQFVGKLLITGADGAGVWYLLEEDLLAADRCDKEEPQPDDWRNGQGRLLNEVLPPGSGWNLVNAAAVTKYGRIVGFGVPPDVPDQTHGFRLTPSTPQPGDLNCDGTANFGDINPFVLSLTDPVAWQAAYHNCPLQNADISGDGSINFGDINPFVALLTRSELVGSQAG